MKVLKIIFLAIMFIVFTVPSYVCGMIFFFIKWGINAGFEQPDNLFEVFK